MLTYGEISAQGYGFTLEAGREALAGSRFWRSTAYSFIGYLDGLPVYLRAGFRVTARFLTYGLADRLD